MFNKEETCQHLFQTFFNKLFSIQEHNFILWAWNRLHLHMLLFLNPRDNSLCLLQDEQLHKKLLALFHKKNSLIKRNGCSLTHGNNYSYHKDQISSKLSDGKPLKLLFRRMKLLLNSHDPKSINHLEAVKLNSLLSLNIKVL